MRSPLVLAVLACLLVLAAPVSAAELRGEEDGRLRIKADTETNELTVSHAAGVATVADAATDLTIDRGCTLVTARTATCPMAIVERMDIETGAGDDEVIVLGPLPAEKLDGGEGDDVLTGGDAADDLTGGDGHDVLTGSGGADVIKANNGDDTIWARDGVRDDIACGAGVDTVDADAEDSVADDCELVTRALALPGLGEVAPDGSTNGDGSATGNSGSGNGGTGETGNGKGNNGNGNGNGGPVSPSGGDANDVDGDGESDAVGPPPAPGSSVSVAPKAGTVRVKQPGGAFVVLQAGDPLPVGSIVDATQGVVTMTAAKGTDGATQTANFTGGRFRVGQSPSARFTNLKLLGGDFSGCGVPAAAAGASPRAFSAGTRRRRGAVRRLWGSGHGTFRTTGRHSAATVRGTVWTVVDRCDGTLTKVKRGVVAVRDLGRKRTTVVRAGNKLLVRAAGKRRR